MFRFKWGRGQDAAADREVTESKDSLKAKIAGKGVNKEFMAYLEKWYDLNEVWNYLQSRSVAQLADYTEYKGEVGSRPREQSREQPREQPHHQGRKDQGRSHERRDTNRSSRTYYDSSGSIIGEGVFLLIGLGLVLLNAAATIYTCTQATPYRLAGFIVGIPLHIGITRVELYMWRRWKEPEYLIGLVSACALDIGSTLYAINRFSRTVFPWLANDAPEDLRDWGTIFRALWAQATANRQAVDFDPQALPAIPGWWLNVLVMTVLSVVIAIFSERLMKKYWRGFKATWRGHYSAA